MSEQEIYNIVSSGTIVIFIIFFGYLIIDLKDKRHLDRQFYDLKNKQLKEDINRLNKKHLNVFNYVRMSSEELNRRIEIFENLNSNTLKVVTVTPYNVTLKASSNGNVDWLEFESFLRLTNQIYSCKYRNKKSKGKK